jgi:Ca2+-binding EF-hand superfamily protein
MQVHVVLASMGRDADEAAVELAMKELDSDGNGTVDFDEFAYVHH